MHRAFEYEFNAVIIPIAFGSLAIRTIRGRVCYRSGIPVREMA